MKKLSSDSNYVLAIGAIIMWIGMVVAIVMKNNLTQNDHSILVIFLILISILLFLLFYQQTEIYYDSLNQVFILKRLFGKKKS